LISAVPSALVRVRSNASGPPSWRSCGEPDEHLERPARGRHEADVDNGSFPDQEAASLQLMVEFVQQAFLHVVLNEALAKATDRGGDGHFVVFQGKANEKDKGEPVYTGFLPPPRRGGFVSVAEAEF